MQGTQHTSGATHVILHFVHFGRRLERYAASVEGDALADQDDRLRTSRGAPVAEHDQLGRLVRTGGNREQRVHAELLHVGALENLAFQVEFPRHCLGLLGHMRRVTDVRWQVAKIFRHGHPLGDRNSLGQASFGLPMLVAPLHRQRQLAQWAAHLVLFGLEPVETVGGLERDHRCLAYAPGDPPFPDGQFGQEERRVESAGRVDCLDGDADGAEEFLFVKLLFLPEANQQDTIAECAGYIVQQKGGRGLAFHIAPPDDVGNIAAGGLVQQFGGQGKLS